MIKPTATVFKQWNFLLGYNLFVILIKVALQLGVCSYLSELLDAGLCWLIQLLGVVCLQNGFDLSAINDNADGSERCEMPTGEARLVWDVCVFIFLIAQRRVFTSNYFQYIVLDLQEEDRLASKGAELINDLLAARVRNKRKEENAVLEGIKKKMQRIREKTAKVVSQKDKQQLDPQSHGEAVRGQGGYYMFQGESDDELSDLDPEINIENEIEEGPLAEKHRKDKEALEAKSSPWQLAFNAVVATPEEALQKDEEKKKESAEHADDDDDYKDASDNALEGVKSESPTNIELPTNIDEQNVKEVSDEVVDDAEEEFRSLVDEDDLEQESDGVIEKTESRLTLIYLIFMRLIDTVVYQLDRISEEYRYVGRELRKLTAEGRKRRAQKKQIKAAEEAATAEVKDETEAPGDGDEIEKVSERAIDVPEETTQEGKRVIIKEDPTTEVDRDQKGSTADEIERSETESQSTETGSSEKFERSMPRPVRLIYATMYVLISQSQLFCYFLIILNNLLSANIPSIILPVFVFLWAMLSVPRPSRRFWIFIITYTEIVVIFKYAFQFTFYPWNSEIEKIDNKDNPLWWPRLFGMDQRDNYAVLDLCILLAVFFHRSILKKHGLWHASQVLPEIEDEVKSDSGMDKAADESDGKKKKKKKKLKKKKEKKKDRKGKKEKAAEEEGAAASAAKAVSSGGDTSQDEDPGQEVKAAEPPPGDGSGDQDQASLVESVEEEKEGFFQPLKDFYNHMVDPTYTAVTDVYVPMFLCDLLNFLIVAFASWAFGENSGQTDVTQLVMSNTIPTTFLILLIIQFVLMIVDRGIYLRKSITAKFIFLIVMVIAVHLYFFFILPEINQLPFRQNTPAQLWYFFKCIYFALSAFQVRSGYPTRILGNCLCKSYSLPNVFAFMGWRAIPFLLEIRILMDWLWTNTTLTLAHWVIVEDIYGNAYITKGWRKMEKEYPVPRGEPKGKVSKYAQGGGMLLGICLIIWFPLIIISLSNTNSLVNPPSDATVSLQLGGYQPIFTMSAQEQNLQALTKSEYSRLKNKFLTDESRSFFAGYKAEDIYKVTIPGESAVTWSISPPSREALMDDLLSDNDMNVKFRYSFTRESELSPVATVSNEYLFVLSAEKNKTVREGLARQLNLTDESSPNVTLFNVFPPYIIVPNEGEPDRADDLLPNGEYQYSNVTLVLQSGGIDQLGDGISEWWSVSEDRKPYLTIYTFNQRVASVLFAPLSGYGIIGLYILIITIVGKFIRTMFSGVSFTIMFTELPNVDRILKLCLDIYLVRECGELALEEDLMAKLIFLYRSPETLIEYTKFKRD
ncbi:piezo-type mechanosensitive ion channel component 2-like isoform X2 [Amphiura filiformis]|uniref:piezo-type mechanosensitive ion channel component 2-like isoform X2 n=1 Tax=Amphiura filiformis TaxID=82378 RepID=UPI003B20F788